MAQPKVLSPITKFIFGLSVLWLNSGQVLAHSEEVTTHTHQDWRPLIVVVACLLVLFGFLGFWRYRCWSQRRQEPEAFVPPPINLPTDSDDDRS